MLIRDKHGKTHFLDYREKAPAAATRDMYLDAKGNVIPGMSLVGYKASGVPGSVAGLTYAQKHYGKLTLAQDMAPAIKLATDGYVLSARRSPRPAKQKPHPLSRLSQNLPARRRLLQRRRHLQAARASRHPQPHRQRPRRLLQRRDGAPDRRLRKGRRRPHHRRRPRRLPGQRTQTHPRQIPRLRPHHRAATILRRHRPRRDPQHPLHLRPAANSVPTAAPRRSTSSPKPSAAPTWTAATTSATPTSTLFP